MVVLLNKYHRERVVLILTQALLHLKHAFEINCIDHCITDCFVDYYLSKSQFKVPATFKAMRNSEQFHKSLFSLLSLSYHHFRFN